MFLRMNAMAVKAGFMGRRHIDRDTATLGAGGSAQDPLSREGFAQRVRTLQQNSLTKVANQQLVVQKGIKAGIDKLAGKPGMAPLNLAGG
jgi:hypothetical protein